MHDNTTNCIHPQRPLVLDGIESNVCTGITKGMSDSPSLPFAKPDESFPSRGPCLEPAGAAVSTGKSKKRSAEESVLLSQSSKCRRVDVEPSHQRSWPALEIAAVFNAVLKPPGFVNLRDLHRPVGNKRFPPLADHFAVPGSGQDELDLPPAAGLSSQLLTEDKHTRMERPPNYRSIRITTTHRTGHLSRTSQSFTEAS